MSTPSLATAVATALERIPPVWPVTHFVAVNPFVGLTDEPFADACRLLERMTGAAPLQSADAYRDLYAQGEITDADLSSAAPGHVPLPESHDRIHRSHPSLPLLRLLSEYADAEEGTPHWAPFFVEEVSRWCGVYFDDNQTTWAAPWRGQGLFTGWREAAACDLNPEIFGLRHCRSTFVELPNDPLATLAECLSRLEVPATMHGDVLYRAALSIKGWMGHARYRQHEARLRGGDSRLPLELLAIRLAFEVALLRSGALRLGAVEQWRTTLPRDRPSPSVLARIVWQQAYERHYQRELASQLCAAHVNAPTGRPSAQVVFCIDVRSEPMRRHLEATAPSVQTIGFAGFFGFAVAYAGDTGRSARCPVLLAPNLPVEATDLTRFASHEKAAAAGAALAFQNAAPATFSFVETLGVSLAPALAGVSRKSSPQCRRADLRFDTSPAALRQLATTAASALRGMGLTENFARLVVFCGHGSHSANNPFASSLDCGACGGHAGDVNARLAAQVLNHPAVRTHLASAGIEIPTDTVFAAALHDTMTDTVALLEPETIPVTHAADRAALCDAFVRAADAARAERTAQLDGKGPPMSREQLEQRGNEASEVRPEWGLANNAAILLAPRARSRTLNLQGRVFLHDYDATRDEQGTWLEGLLAAPVVVASWINLQYYASRIDPALYGAGRKVLHNVVGGIGVLEGNGGDLRVGLPWESVHDGERFRHAPRRLTVFVEASRPHIARALSAKPEVAALIEHEWIHLMALEGNACYQFTRNGWTPFGAATTS